MNNILPSFDEKLVMTGLKGKLFDKLHWFCHKVTQFNASRGNLNLDEYLQVSSVGPGEMVGLETFFNADRSALFTVEMASDTLAYYKIPDRGIPLVFENNTMKQNLVHFVEVIIRRLEYFVTKQMVISCYKNEESVYVDNLVKTDPLQRALYGQTMNEHLKETEVLVNTEGSERLLNIPAFHGRTLKAHRMFNLAEKAKVQVVKLTTSRVQCKLDLLDKLILKNSDFETFDKEKLFRRLRRKELLEKIHQKRHSKGTSQVFEDDSLIQPSKHNESPRPEPTSEPVVSSTFGVVQRDLTTAQNVEKGRKQNSSEADQQSKNYVQMLNTVVKSAPTLKALIAKPSSRNPSAFKLVERLGTEASVQSVHDAGGNHPKGNFQTDKTLLTSPGRAPSYYTSTGYRTTSKFGMKGSVQSEKFQIIANLIGSGTKASSSLLQQPLSESARHLRMATNTSLQNRERLSSRRIGLTQNSELQVMALPKVFLPNKGLSIDFTEDVNDFGHQDRADTGRSRSKPRLESAFADNNQIYASIKDSLSKDTQSTPRSKERHRHQAIARNGYEPKDSSFKGTKGSGFKVRGTSKDRKRITTEPIDPSKPKLVFDSDSQLLRIVDPRQGTKPNEKSTKSKNVMAKSISKEKFIQLKRNGRGSSIIAISGEHRESSSALGTQMLMNPLQSSNPQRKSPVAHYDIDPRAQNVKSSRFLSGVAGITSLEQETDEELKLKDAKEVHFTSEDFPKTIGHMIGFKRMSSLGVPNNPLPSEINLQTIANLKESSTNAELAFLHMPTKRIGSSKLK